MLYILIALFRGNSITLKQVLYYLVFGKASTPLYYIIVMLQLTIITPYIIKRKIRVWMYMITPIYVLVLYVYNISIGETLPLYETWFCAWFIFYLLGIDCRRGRWNHIINRAKNWWIIIALLFSIVEAFILAEMSENVGFACSQITFGSFVYTLAMIAWFMKNENTRRECVLSLVGNYSYGIYFCHMIVLMIVKKLLSIIGVADMWFVYYILTFLLTTLGSVFVVGLVRDIATRANARKILKVLGF